MNFLEILYEAIELEKEAEIKAMINEIKQYGKNREKIGRAINNLNGKYIVKEMGRLHLIKFGRKESFKTDISVGDIVLVSKGNPLKSELTGSVTEIGNKYIIIAFSNNPPIWVQKSKNIRIDLYLNEITFKRMQNAILKLHYAEGKLKILKSIILGNKKPKIPKKMNLTFFDTALNNSQKEAVKKASGSEDVFLIHGPPGTGKTRTLTEVILQEIKLGKKVLATADSNTATDNLLFNLVKYSHIKVCRLGHPTRIDTKLKQHSLFYLVENHHEYKKINEIREKAMKLSEERDNYIKPTPQFRRGLTDSQIEKYALKERGTRGIFPKAMKSMYNWIKLNNEVQELYNKARRLENDLIKKIISESDVIVSTNSSAGIEELEEIKFDTIVIDEGSQATEPSCYIPIVHGKKIIMGGDHKQLPPTILNNKAKKVLSRTLFEKLINLYPENSSILTIQYRMNEAIMQFSNNKFYNGILKSHKTVKNKTLNIKANYFEYPYNEILDKTPIVFVDTSLVPEKFEVMKKGSTSKYNPFEAKIIIRIANILNNEKIDFGVISPYNDQVKFLKEKIEGTVNTVDGFQGKEKDVIIFSLTRSNEEGLIGFLTDERRLNVAITRAKRKLIIIGNIKTIEKYTLFKEFIEYIKTNGKIITLINLDH
ncbi:DNA helicase, putative [Marinitoga hydrogenitolerans DSM 16785]|uniref:DNA helicase, putative n=1 Tax=Marinitoga hydrogenitolerans (strain DSM 16785 / JCM 12826 / AT1271) TaxID=1122195 RepID=A0A1M4VHI3_MARH1|nr:IGHMBP2 family helicase [Marinitoga hydrogenitolerans]SHE68486.1 DNA helicase, putative [Marinitoga hydrogenitolerans DSM 16785]